MHTEVVSKAETRESVLSEFVLVLVPLGLTFLSIGMPGIRIGPAVLHPYQIALAGLVVLALVDRREGFFKDLLASRGTTLLGLGLAISAFASIFFKGFAYEELREFKNTILPMVVVFLILARFFSRVRRAERALLAVALGILGSVGLIFFFFRAVAFGVRVIGRDELREATGLTYVWIGVGGVVIVAAGLVRAFDARAAFSARVAHFAIVLAGAFALLFSGTRAAVGAAILFPLVLLTLRVVSRRVVNAGIILAVTVLFAASMLPSTLLDMVPNQKYRTRSAPEAAERLTAASGYKDDLTARLLYWERMLTDSEGLGLWTGVHYGKAMERTGFLSHPHNVFLWARVIGGMPAALCVYLGILSILLTAVRCYLDAPRTLLPLARSHLYLHFSLFPILITNSWAGGTQLAFGVAAALTVFLVSAMPAHHRASRKRVVRADQDWIRWSDTIAPERLAADIRDSGHRPA